LRQFSDQHLAAIAVMVLAATLAVWCARRSSERTTELLARGLALLIIAGWAGEYLADALLGTWSVKYDLPLQLTDVISVVSTLALWTRRRRLVELSYLWAMTATLQAILTPDLGHGFPSVFYFTYFTYHVGAVVGACLLVFGERLYLQRGAVRRVYLTTIAWACVAGLGDVITGGNYMYLRAKPANSSLLSAMGPWPWYVVETVLVVAPVFLFLAWGLAALVERADSGHSPIRASIRVS
jgi:hypothetical integral membrane protein (TIGR02206 family)